MGRHACAALVCLALAAGPGDAGSGTAPKAPPGDVPGALVIVGGGKLPDSVRDCFLELAGGKQAHIVVIPTASMAADRPRLLRSFAYWQSQDVASVRLLHTRSREEANDPDFVRPLAEATGVWLAGGDQSRLTAAYRGTAVEEELRKLLARGGVIGGTSAGAAVMSPLMILGGNQLAQVGRGFGLLPGVVVDQHFDNRHRLHRLLGVLEKYPEYLGIGIDEQTAVVVRGHSISVVGNAHVRLCLPTPGKDPAVQVLKSGERADLLALSPAPARAGVATSRNTMPMARDRGALSP